MRLWVLKRQMVGVIFFSLIAIGLAAFAYYLIPENTCKNGVKDAQEEGIDCGAVCPNACPIATRNMKTLWVRTFSVRGNLYDAGAMIENLNYNAGARSVRYTFRLYDASRALIAQKSGTSFIYPEEPAFLYEPLLETGGKKPVVVDLALDEIEWERMQPMKDLQIEVVHKEFVSDAERAVRATLSNRSLFDEQPMEVVALLEGADGNVYAASRTRLDNLKGKSQGDVIFTWPGTVFESPAKINILYRRLP